MENIKKENQLFNILRGVVFDGDYFVHNNGIEYLQESDRLEIYNDSEKYASIALSIEDKNRFKAFGQESIKIGTYTVVYPFKHVGKND